ncbi:MAG TPA: hypothetical protein VMG10_06400 [Gemmataceae bacterium]|nr:hypothetical protein [Gemmataceae bacterium]
MDIRDSSTYWTIFDEGRIEEAQRSILLVGQQKFGLPSDTIVATIKGINNLEHLERLIDRILTICSWDELLATP